MRKASAATQILNRDLFQEGKPIFRERDRGQFAYVIEKGRVEISRQSGDDKIVLGVLGENALFGEMALIDDSPRMATATALEATTCLLIPLSVFRNKMAKTDPFVRAFVKLLMDNVRGMSDRMILGEEDDGKS